MNQDKKHISCLDCEILEKRLSLLIWMACFQLIATAALLGFVLPLI